MEDSRIWAFEESLWTADPDHYARSIDEGCVMVVPAAPFVLVGADAVDAVAQTPRWDRVEFSEQRVTRPQEGLIVIGYHVEASRGDGPAYAAWCTSTYRRLGPDEWRVVQHQQTLEPVA